jgi:hypothetical protein
VFARATTVCSSLRLLLVLLPVLVCASACEVVANFDPKRLNTDRTVGPVPLPSSDGAVALIPDAASLPDGALIQPEASDAQVAHARGDAGSGLDAGSALDAAASSDAGEPAQDAASEVDSGLVGLLDAGS